MRHPVYFLLQFVAHVNVVMFCGKASFCPGEDDAVDVGGPNVVTFRQIFEFEPPVYVLHHETYPKQKTANSARVQRVMM
jgi:hypothetical protein